MSHCGVSGHQSLRLSVGGAGRGAFPSNRESRRGVGAFVAEIGLRDAHGRGVAEGVGGRNHSQDSCTS